MRFRSVAFLQHGESDKPGILADVLLGRGISLDIIRADLGQPIPENLESYDGLAVGGGAQAAYQTDLFPYLADEIRLVRQTVTAQKPVLGLCLGAQLMAAALGGSVRPSGFAEIGFYPVVLEPPADFDSLWTGMPKEFVPAHWHGDIFELPPGAMPLGHSQLTPRQAYRLGPHSYGFQFHLEMTPEIFEEMVGSSREELLEQGYDPDQLIAQARKCLPPLRPVAETVFSRWADFL